jgi:hypothetical protein
MDARSVPFTVDSGFHELPSMDGCMLMSFMLCAHFCIVKTTSHGAVFRKRYNNVASKHRDKSFAPRYFPIHHTQADMIRLLHETLSGLGNVSVEVKKATYAVQYQR